MTTKAMIKVPTFWIFLLLFGALTTVSGVVYARMQADITDNQVDIKTLDSEVDGVKLVDAGYDEKLTAIQNNIDELKADVKEILKEMRK